MAARNSATLEATFARQFEERSGYIFYRRTPFTHPPFQSPRAFTVSREERDRFIADFNRDAPLIQKKIARDFFIAIVSFMVSAAFVRIIASHWDVLILTVHLITIFVIENRRLKFIWDAPVRALIGRPSSDWAPEPTKRFYKPIKNYTMGELVLGILFGIIGAGSLTGLVRTGRGPNIGLEFYAFVAALMSYFVIVGVRCFMTIYNRAMKSQPKHPRGKEYKRD
jgi:hypothetical protein